MTDEQCGHTKNDDTPCELPASRDDGKCHHHTESEEQARGGRPKRLKDERRQQIVYTAVSTGLSVEHQADLAQVHPDTLRRGLCCVKTPREPTLETDDPCDFCDGYVQAHARGALEVLQDCRPEFRAAATFGYTDKHEVEHSGELDLSDVTVDFENTDT